MGTLGNSITQYLHTIIYADCDGVVAIDAITLTGRSLSTSQRGGVYSETRDYPGAPENSTEYKFFESAVGCGRTSDYSVTWSATLQPSPSQLPPLISTYSTYSRIGGLAAYDAPEIYVGQSQLSAGHPAGDNRKHVIVAPEPNNGLVREYCFPSYPNETFRWLGGSLWPDPYHPVDPNAGYLQGLPFVGVGGYFSASYDGLQHVVVGTPPGVWEGTFEVRDEPPQYKSVALDHNIVALAAYYDWVHNQRCLVLATADGRVKLSWVDYSPVPLQNGPGGGTKELARFLSAAYLPSFIEGAAVKFSDDADLRGSSGIIGVTGYVSARDNTHHIVVATTDGDVHDLWGALTTGDANPAHDVRAHFDGIVGLAGYFADSDNFQHIMVATQDGRIHDVWFAGRAWAGQSGQATRGHFTDIVAIAAYFGKEYADYRVEVVGDSYHHVFVGLKDGTVHEVAWSP